MIIKDLAVILPGTILPEATVVPSMSIWGGTPGERLFEECELSADMRQDGSFQPCRRRIRRQWRRSARAFITGFGRLRNITAWKSDTLASVLYIGQYEVDMMLQFDHNSQHRDSHHSQFRLIPIWPPPPAFLAGEPLSS